MWGDGVVFRAFVSVGRVQHGQQLIELRQCQILEDVLTAVRGHRPIRQDQVHMAGTCLQGRGSKR